MSDRDTAAISSHARAIAAAGDLDAAIAAGAPRVQLTLSPAEGVVLGLMRQSGLYGQITALMGASYTLHTPEALRETMRRGKSQVFHPAKAAPFHLLLPINTQPQNFSLNLASLPGPDMASPGSAAAYAVMEAARITAAAERPVIKAGGRRPADLNRGHFLEPTVLTDVPDHARVMNEEPITGFSKTDDMIARGGE